MPRAVQGHASMQKNREFLDHLMEAAILCDEELEGWRIFRSFFG